MPPGERYFSYLLSLKVTSKENGEWDSNCNYIYTKNEDTFVTSKHLYEEEIMTTDLVIVGRIEK